MPRLRLRLVLLRDLLRVLVHLRRWRWKLLLWVRVLLSGPWHWCLRWWWREGLPLLEEHMHVPQVSQEHPIWMWEKVWGQLRLWRHRWGTGDTGSSAMVGGARSCEGRLCRELEAARFQ